MDERKDDVNTQDENGVDFSQLPDVILVKILEYLSLVDRYHMSVTCRALYDVFQHPSLWHTQRLHIYGDHTDFPDPNFKSSIFHSYLNVTRYFGKYFQNLTLKVNGHLCEIQDELQDLLLEVGQQCRLETLTIDVGLLTSDFHQMYVEPPSTSAIFALTSFVKNAYRMRHLHIRSWPLFQEIDNDECNIFKVFTCNEKLKNLETLTMFMVDGKGWSERQPCLITHKETHDVLTYFHNLTRIGLRTPMLNEQILQMLAEPERAKLHRLEVFVHYLDPNRTGKPRFGVPIVSSKTWKALHRRNTDFRVEMTVFLKVPHVELANLWKPEVPVSSITYMKYAKIDPATLTLLYNHNHDTLVSYHSYCDSYDLDQELIQLVTKCKDLVEFVHHGEIRLATVVWLAKQRGESWKKFEVLRNRIKVPGEYDDVDEDQVLAPDRDGNLVLVGLMRHHRSDEDEGQAIDSMTADVSQALGYSWKPS